MKIDFDVDIDMANRDDFLKLVNCTPASIVNDKGMYSKHNTGVYFQNINTFPLEGYSAIEHKQAEEDGWFKVDILNNHVYKGIRNEAHLDKLVATVPMWELFGHREIVEELFHINKHYEIVKQHQPTSIEQLAMILAMIRPGKRYLVGKSWEQIEKEVWVKTDEYFFKHSHAIGYALAIVVQLNLICES
mgnify:FL=1|jgi:hypothetical protein|tara:strand:+ start:247 stop:813 length:567 start_codon:yes stop_codon:yes gene_type:complete